MLDPVKWRRLDDGRMHREEPHGGATILNALRNAVYPQELKGADSGVVRVVELP